jgi:hypothetical protein
MKPRNIRRSALQLVLVLLLSVVPAVSAYGIVSATNPSTFNDTFNGCPWTGYSRLLGTVSYGFTSSTCQSNYLYLQFIKSGGTEAIDAVGWEVCTPSDCSNYDAYTTLYPPAPFTETYGEHATTANWQTSSTRSTDATY